VRYLSSDDIVSIHDDILCEIGGLAGIREPGLLASIAEKPKTSFGGQDLYPDILTKAASLL
jgi:death-on-curing protein